MDEQHTSENNGELETLRKELAETQARLEMLTSIINLNPAVVFLWKMADGWPVEFVSESVSQFGYTAQELLSGEVSWPGITYSQDVPRLEAEIKTHIARGDTQFNQEYRLVTKSGEIRWVEDRNIMIRDSSGQITHIQGMIIDITARKRTETALRDSETSLKAAQELAYVGSWQWDLQTDAFVMSDELLRINGLSAGDPPSNLRDVVDALIHPDDRARIHKIMEGVLAGGEGQKTSFRIIHADGTVRWVTGAKPIIQQRLEDGRPAVIMGTIQDVTEQRAAQIAIQQSKEKYRAVVESAADSICTINTDGVFTFMSPVCIQRLGGSDDKLIGKTLWDVFPKKFADHELLRIREAIASERGSSIEILAPIADEMQWRQLSREPIFEHDGTVNSVLVISRDIHEQKTAAIAIQQSEEKYRAVVESAADAICTINVEGEFLFMNTVCAQRLGETVEQLVSKTLWDVFPKEFADQEAIRARDTIVSGQSSTVEVSVPLGAESRWYQIAMEPIKDHDGKIRSVLIIARDIHEQRIAEIDLRASKEHLQAIITSLHQTAILVYDLNGDIRSCWASSEMDERYGIDTKALVGKNLRESFNPEIAERRIQSIEDVYKTGWSVRDEWLGNLPNGDFWIETTLSPLKDADGNITNVVAFARDITDRKKTEGELQHSEQRYKALFEGTIEGILVAEIKTQKYLFANPAICEMMNYSVEEFLEMRIGDGHPPEDLAHVVECFQAQARGEYKVAPNIPFLTRDGEVFYADVSAALINFEGKDCAVGFIHDLTESRQAEEQLRQSEQRHRKLFEGASEGILAVDIETHKIAFSNPAVRKMLKYSDEKLRTMNIEECHRPENVERLMLEFDALVSGESQMALAVSFLTSDGEIVYADVGATIIRLEGRDCVVGFLRDLTDSRRAEEALKTAHRKLMTARDEERKHLASELHDSVSQKLVALGMQLSKITNMDGPEPTETCNELIADIRGICHGLYPPALEALGLIPAMRQLEEYGKSAGITTTIQCDPVIKRARLAPEIEIALFRIAQEAVNNAIRHSGASTIDIDLMRDKQQLIMAIVDNGSGFNIKAAEGKGLGLSSIRDRANGIAAKLTLSSEPGETRIEVSVKAELKETNQKEEQ